MILSPFNVPNEGIQHKEDNTHAFVDGNDAGNGSLYITQRQVVWVTPTGEGFNLEYPSICLHAVSKDLTQFPEECLYMMVDGKLIEPPPEPNDDDDADDFDSPTTEVRFVPSDKTALDGMFAAMSDCQALHPDPEDSPDSEADDDQGNFYEGEEGVDELTEQGQATLQHLENLLAASQGQGDGLPVQQDTPNGSIEPTGENMQTGQFEDADMQE